MLEISKFILSMYDGAQNASPADFCDNQLDKLQPLLKFDSAGVLSFRFSELGQLQITSAVSFNLNDSEKLEAKNDFQLPGRMLPGQSFVGADPLLIKCFENKYQSYCADSIPAEFQPECGIRTRKLHTMVMVVDDQKSGGFSSAALWRNKIQANYSQQERQLNDVLMPHFFSAMRINRSLSEVPVASGTGLLEPVICSATGLIHFIDSAIFKLFESEWPDWKPPSLPAEFFNKIRRNSGIAFVGRCFIARGHVLGDLLVLNIEAKISNGNLTPMEFRVASLLGRGASYKEIALQMGTAPATVRNQAHSIYLKLRISRKSEVAAALKAQGYSSH